jgi:alpha-galactosidase
VLLLMNIIIITIIIISTTSSWGRERYVQEMELSHGMRSFGSMRGVSGHVHNPFAGTVYE